MSTSTMSIVRDRYVAKGLHEDISIVNHSPTTKTVHLRINCDADFADVFEVRAHLGPVKKAGRISVEKRDGQHICLVYRRGEFIRETWINFSAEPEIKEKTASFEVILQPKGSWKTCVNIIPIVGTTPARMKCVAGLLGHPFGPYRRGKPTIDSLRSKSGPGILENDLPQLETDHLGLQQVYNQALADLRSLRMEFTRSALILAAGAPWFVAVFGRDSIIAAIQTKLLGPELMIGTLRTLSSLQAKEHDEFREADPGKIPHEVRKGELSILEHVPH